MAHRKHTPCGACGQKSFCRRLEVMWRLDAEGPWTWLAAWTCAGCRSGSLHVLGELVGQILLWDG